MATLSSVIEQLETEERYNLTPGQWTLDGIFDGLITYKNKRKQHTHLIQIKADDDFFSKEKLDSLLKKKGICFLAGVIIYNEKIISRTGVYAPLSSPRQQNAKLN